MRKVILMIILGVACNSAFAEWTEVGGSDIGAVYADLSTIRKNGDTVKMWLLHDFTAEKTKQGNNYLSEKRLNEYNCGTEEVRSHAYFLFSTNMGRGDMVFSEEVSSFWSLVEPASADYSSLKVACKNSYEIASKLLSSVITFIIGR